MGFILIAGVCGQACDPWPMPGPEAPDEQVLDARPPAPDGTAGDSGVATPPIAHAGGNQTVDILAEVILDGSASVSTSGLPLAYTWRQTEGPEVALQNPHSAMASFSAPAVAEDTTLSFVLTVHDASASAQDRVNVIIVAPRAPADSGEEPAEPLVLDIFSTETNGAAPLEVQFQVAARDGSPLPDGAYVWSFDDGSLGEGLTVTHTFTSGRATPYLVTVCLVLPGAVGCSDDSPKAQLAVTAYAATDDKPDPSEPPPPAANQRPIANAGPDQIVNEGTAVTLDGSASTDRNGDALFFAWEQLGGPAVALSGAAGARPSFVAPAVDSDKVLTFKLTVSDAESSVSDLILVYVKDAGGAANQRPVVTQGASVSIAVQKDGSATFQLAATDVDAAPGSLAWSISAPPAHGSAGVMAGSPSSSGGLITIRYQAAAGYVGGDTFTVKVDDGRGGSATTTVNVVVGPPGSAGVWIVNVNHPAASDTAADAGTEAKPFRSLAKAASIVRPGDTVYVRAGRYTSSSPRNYRGVLEIKTSGTIDRPITFRRYGTDEVIIDAQGGMQAYAVRLGDPFSTTSRIEHVIVDGFKCTGGYKNGIHVLRPNNVTIRNCEVYRNNQAWEAYGTVAYEWGVFVVGGEYCTIEGCRVYNNGGGIGFSEVDQTAVNPVGSRYCSVRDNFIYANSNSGNYGNSSGIGMRFGEFSTIEGNVLYDNPDAAVNGLGNIHNRFLRNACFNSWQQPGNMEGLKFCVRGGGANLMAFNIAAYNGQRGFDSTDGIGDICLNNTFYANEQWGLLLEGRKTLVMNTLSYLNYPNNNGRKDIIISTADSMLGVSDYNLFGDEASLPQVGGWSFRQTHTINSNPQLVNPRIAFVRQDIRQIVHPELLFTDANRDGVVTIDEARAEIAGRYALGAGNAARGAGARLSEVQKAISGSVPEIVAAAQKRIAEKTGTGLLQWNQAISMWTRLATNLQSTNRAGIDKLSGLSDFAGSPVSLEVVPNIGAVQK